LSYEGIPVDLCLLIYRGWRESSRLEPGLKLSMPSAGVGGQAGKKTRPAGRGKSWIRRLSTQHSSLIKSMMQENLLLLRGCPELEYEASILAGIQ